MVCGCCVLWVVGFAFVVISLWFLCVLWLVDLMLILWWVYVVFGV